jgi:DNA-binding NtrC family response regulator
MKIAIVEDDINVRKSLEIAMSDYDEFTIETFRNPTLALKKLDDSFELIITDLNMPKMDGLEFIKELNGKYDVIIITGNATLTRAVQSIKLGVKDFLIKPFEIETLIEAIKRTRKIKKITESSEATKKSNLNSEKENRENSDFLTVSKALEKSVKIAKKSAKTDISVLLTGESGVGKEVFARFIHDNSPRKNNPFIAINMAAIPENLLESELFGYEKGAFTDALSAKEGLFESANGGTLFLDEIAEMPYNLQAKLLRALQEREIQRLGSSQKINIDVRIVSATNANIENMIATGEFREDLFYRINTIPVVIPPLRERTEEILPIAEDILLKVIKKYDLESKIFSEKAKIELVNYNWPGNIRELISVVERATILSESHEIQAEEFFLSSRKSENSTSSKNEDLPQMEKDFIQEVLNKFDFNKTESAQFLGIAPAVLERKIKQYGI